MSDQTAAQRPSDEARVALLEILKDLQAPVGATADDAVKLTTVYIQLLASGE